MPITKTSDGLILFEDFETLDGVYFAGSIWTLHLSTAHVTGAHSLYGEIWNGALTKTLNLGTGAGRKFHIWHALGGTCAWFYPVQFGDYSYYGDPASTTAHSWQHLKGSVPDGKTGDQICYFMHLDSTDTGFRTANVEGLCVVKSDYLTITSLTSGQKVEVWLGISKIAEGTVAWGATQVAIDISATPPPAPLHLKIYQADGTLFEDTPNTTMWPGDVWDWNPNNGTLSINSSVFIIYRQASAGSPKTATITATLLKPNGTPYAGKTVTFSASFGAVGSVSAVTDTTGHATTSLASSDHGIAIVKAEWAGDAVAPAARVFLTVHAFEDAEVPDTNKQFQFFNQGIEFAFDSGEYAINGEGVTEPFQVIIPAWDSRLTKDGLMSIYRKGVKEFGGVLKIAKRTIGSRSVTLSGSDASILLSDRVLDVETFPAWYPQDILAYLLAKYPTCVTAGGLDAYPSYVSLMFSTEDLRSVIQRLCTLVGWTARINADLSLDFAETFGTGLKSVSFTEGTNLTGGERTDDYTTIANSIHMKGDGISSIRSDADSIFSVGVHEIPAFQATISDQATLDAACAALLDQKKNAEEQITIEVVDNYAVGAFAPEDTITAASPTLEASGSYVVKRIHRDMTDANWAKLELTSRKLEEWEYDSEYQRMVKDATVLV